MATWSARREWASSSRARRPGACRALSRVTSRDAAEVASTLNKGVAGRKNVGEGKAAEERGGEEEQRGGGEVGPRLCRERNVDDVLEIIVGRDPARGGVRRRQRRRQSVRQDRRRRPSVEHKSGTGIVRVTGFAAGPGERDLGRRVALGGRRVIGRRRKAAAGACVQIDGVDVRARGAACGHRGQRSADNKR